MCRCVCMHGGIVCNVCILCMSYIVTYANYACNEYYDYVCVHDSYVRYVCMCVCYVGTRVYAL